MTFLANDIDSSFTDCAASVAVAQAVVHADSTIIPYVSLSIAICGT